MALRGAGSTARKRELLLLQAGGRHRVGSSKEALGSVDSWFAGQRSVGGLVAAGDGVS